MNRVFLIGNLTRDPEIKRSEKGVAIAIISLAVNQFYRNREGELVEKTHFFNVETYARQAELCEKYLQKGKKIAVEGRLRQDRWESKDGSHRSRVCVVSEQIQFLTPKGQKAAPTDLLMEPVVDEDEIPF